ncbi:hypothetical protein VTL71DRAFT_13535 [Oculimacula yallundae]|uniref:2EXR domain-containing protein n=1 Tax=Oculimacula yallundae TaxID=86028 RepID=A0ABR4CKR0_9HELO
MPTAFPLFPLLPPELRLKILTFASLPPLSPKIHLLAPHPLHPGTYISNQPPHALLSTTSLARSIYLSSTQALPAFNTYVSFTHDIFYYITPVTHLNTTRLTAFLACEDVKDITRFAVKRELFDRAHREILEGMEALEKLWVVWKDWRPVREALLEREIGFRELDEEGGLMRRGEAHTEYILKMCRQRYSEGGPIEKKAARYHERGPVRIRLGLVE